MYRTKASGREVAPPLSDRELAAIPPTLRSFPPQNPNQLLASQDTGFRYFHQLPAEIMLDVLCFMPCPDLLNLLQVGGWIRRFFAVYQQKIFNGIQRRQYPELSNLFGDLPSFLPFARTSLTGAEDIMHAKKFIQVERISFEGRQGIFFGTAESRFDNIFAETGLWQGHDDVIKSEPYSNLAALPILPDGVTIASLLAAADNITLSRANVGLAESTISERRQNLPSSARGLKASGIATEASLAEEAEGKRPSLAMTEKRQKQDLEAAIHMQCFRYCGGSHDSGSYAKRAFRLYMEGGWWFLAFLGTLNSQLDGDTAHLFFFLRAFEPVSRKIVRQAVLCLELMCWRAYRVTPGPDDVAEMHSRVTEGMEIYRSQPADIRRLVKSTLRLLLLEVTPYLDLDDLCSAVMASYQESRSSSPSLSMMDDTTLYNFTFETMAGLLVHSCFHHGILMFLYIKDKGEKTMVAKLRTKIRIDLMWALLDRCEADRRSELVERNDRTARVEEGMLWMNELNLRVDGV